MTPEDQAQLQQGVETIAAILDRNTPGEQLQTLEGIEQAIREQTQQTVLPEIGIFLSQQQLKQPKATPEP